MFDNILNRLSRGRKQSVSARSRSSASPRLEELESRLTPSWMGPGPPGSPFATVTNASVLIVPNLSNMTVTEVVRATVSNAPSVPPGTPNPSLGLRYRPDVRINLNNQQQSVQLDSNSQATAIFTMPLFVFMAGQELTVQYSAGLAGPSGVVVYNASYFNSPLYVNYDNLLHPAVLTFTPLSSDQMSVYPGLGYWPPYSPFGNGETAWPPYTSLNGETDNFGSFSFQYADPGVITSIQALGLQLPGIFAAALGAYGPGF